MVLGIRNSDRIRCGVWSDLKVEAGWILALWIIALIWRREAVGILTGWIVALVERPGRHFGVFECF